MIVVQVYSKKCNYPRVRNSKLISNPIRSLFKAFKVHCICFRLSETIPTVEDGCLGKSGDIASRITKKSHKNQVFQVNIIAPYLRGPD